METEPEETLSRSKDTAVTHTEAQQSWGRIFDLQSKLVRSQEASALLEEVIILSSIQKNPLTIHPHITASWKKATLHPHCSRFNPHTWKTQHLRYCSLLFTASFPFSAFISPKSTPLSSVELALRVQSKARIYETISPWMYRRTETVSRWVKALSLSQTMSNPELPSLEVQPTPFSRRLVFWLIIS